MVKFVLDYLRYRYIFGIFSLNSKNSLKQTYFVRVCHLFTYLGGGAETESHLKWFILKLSGSTGL